MRTLIAITATASLASALLATWLLVMVVPEVSIASQTMRSEASRQRTFVDDMIERSLALAMFERDYGEVQDLLSRYVAAGHFSQAVVVNNQRNVVASLGSTLDLEVGRPVPESALNESRKMALSLHTEQLGELYARVPAVVTIKLDGAERQLDQLRKFCLVLGALSWAAALGLSALLVTRR